MDKKKTDNIIHFAKEAPLPPQKRNHENWKVLITDDEKSMHYITEKTLSDFIFKGRKLTFLHAYSGEESEKIMEKNPDTALVLLDIQLETENAGLNLIYYIRKTLNNAITQIVIRTGQPENAPEHSVIEEYEINDYRLKTELTTQKLYAVVTASLRSFQIKADLKNELEKRKKSEASLKRSETRLRDIAQNIGEWIWEFDTLGRYTYVSENAEKISGYSPKELKGKDFHSLFSDKSKKSALQRINKNLSATEPFMDIETWIIDKNGSKTCLLTSGKPFRDEHGTLLGYRGVNKDISQLKNAEKEKEKLISQLRTAQRLEAIGTLAGGIAHDFNNILGSIMGYTQLLQMDIKKDKKGTHYTEQILKGCNRAKNLIIQLLDFSRVNKTNSTKSAISPAIIIKEEVKLLSASIPSSIKIKTEISDKTGKILAEPAQIQQLIMRLCTNSLQAIKNNQGNILIKVERISFSKDGTVILPSPDLDFGEYIAISVIDDGTGIEPDTMEKIFEPYFSTKKGGDGTGLGLSVVHGIINQCHGAAVVESTLDKGTEFTLYFPAHTIEKEKNMQSNNSIKKGKGKILFVDDEKMLVDLGKVMLDKLGYNTIALQSPLDALTMIQNNPFDFDIVITDMTMPEMQGTKLAYKIKQIRSDMPIILVSGLASLADSEETNPIGVDAVLPKPISMNVLFQTIHNLLIK